MFKLNPLTNAHMRVAIYIRVSTDEQAREGHSLDAQLKICRHFAESRGWEIAGVFRDPENPDDLPLLPGNAIRRKASSSGKTDKRPGFQKLLAVVRRGGADVVITHKLDRFSRSITDILLYMRELNKLGVAYTSATEQFDFTTPIGKVMLTMLAAFAEWYLDNLSSETKKGKRARAEKGYWNGDLPFGYRLAQNSHDAEPAPGEADAVRMAFAKYAEGICTDLDIAKFLNAADYRTRGKRGSIPFSKDTVCAMLQNIFYSGKVTYKGEVFPGRQPAIVNSELFEKCRVVRGRKASQPKRANARTRTYPLAGLIYCADCKRPHRGQTMHDTRYYRDVDHMYDGDCAELTTLPARELENKVAETLLAIELPKRWQEIIANRLDNSDDAATTERKRVRINAKIRRAQELYVEGLMTREDYDLKKLEAQSELDALKPVDLADMSQVAKLLSRLPQVWPLANAEERKTLCQAMLERVYVRSNDIVAIQPRPELWALFMSVVGSGPDGIRTRDLGLDRAACLAATPRVQNERRVNIP